MTGREIAFCLLVMVWAAFVVATDDGAVPVSSAAPQVIGFGPPGSDPH